jgi:8-oxo-dGTP pyrophosphatase MutT (NUDIX family)
VLLLKNERDEWELPGGRLETGETPRQCVVREIEEETGWPVTAAQLLDAWVYDIAAVGRQVFIVTYGCHLGAGAPEPVVSEEHREVGEFAEAEVLDLPMPQGYKDSVVSWFTMQP